MTERSASRKASKQVLLDTSFILTLTRQHRDPCTEVRDLIPGKLTIFTMDLVILEMERLARRGSATIAAEANAGLALMEKAKISVVEHRPGPTEVDSALIAHALAERTPTAIATVDRELRKVLTADGIPTIWPTSHRRLLANTL